MFLIFFEILPQSKTSGCDLLKLQTFLAFNCGDLLSILGLQAFKLDAKMPIFNN